MADASDLTAWARDYGPEYLRFAAEHGATVKSGTMDYLGEKVAALLGGRLIRDDIVTWKPREQAALEWVARWAALGERLQLWNESRSFPDDVPLPAELRLEPLTVVRIEEQPDPTDPKRVLKYTGTIVKLSHPAAADRLVLLNFEAHQKESKER